MTDWQTAPNGRGQGDMARFLNHIFGVGETRHFKCRVPIYTEVW